MKATQRYRIDLAAPEVEVVTVRVPDRRWLTRIFGGRLDGERFLSADPRQHRWAIRLARATEEDDDN